MARSAPAPADPIETARDLGIDTCGRIAEFWGFTRTMGRTFGLLYFSPSPLSQAQIQARLQISAGSASMTLTALGRWGVVHRVWVPGHRREHYESETDFWKMISGVLNERERREIGAAVAALAKAKQVTQGLPQGTTAARKADGAFLSQRLERLDDICQLGQTLLDMLLGQMKMDVAKFRDVLRVGAIAPGAEQRLPKSTRKDTKLRGPRKASAEPARRAKRKTSHSRG